MQYRWVVSNNITYTRFFSASEKTRATKIIQFFSFNGKNPCNQKPCNSIQTYTRIISNNITYTRFFSVTEKTRAIQISQVFSVAEKTRAIRNRAIMIRTYTRFFLTILLIHRFFRSLKKPVQSEPVQSKSNFYMGLFDTYHL